MPSRGCNETLRPIGGSTRDQVQVANVVAMMSFAAVVATGSFSAAAERLNCSKAAVSASRTPRDRREG